MLAATLVVLSGTGFLRYQDFSREHQRLAEITRDWEKTLREERQQFAELSAEQERLLELQAAGIDAPPASPTLTQLTVNLPQTMWVTHYSQNYDTADITLSAVRDESDLYNRIGETDHYRIVNLRKNRGYNDTITYFIKLRLKH